jgi:autotransporter-associated beta strand protein
MRAWVILSSAMFLAAPLRGEAWIPVPAADFSQIQLSQFADHELEVPYHLRHFAQVANSVVETPFTDSTGTLLPRGFLNLKVNREPADNKPYNARIMEMQAALAYFYTADRPWNPYRGNHAVRLRLEAMLTRWSEVQAPPGHPHDGLFSEYSATNWSLAPTGFGVRHAAEALDLIVDSGQPFDAAVMENARVSLRRALMALFARADMRNAARQYSNQLSGAWHAALIYQENWPDTELDNAFVAAVNAASTQDQSPAGYWYEQGGPDVGYTNVHDANMRIALPRLRHRNDLLPLITTDDTHWNHWLAAMLVPQPGLATRTFLVNGGHNTRTNESVKTPGSRPYAEFVETSRIFALTDFEYSAAVVSRRAQVQSQFGNWGPLSVPSSSSYIPSFVHDAVTPLNVWHPATAQREAAHASLACLAPASANRQFRDPLPTVFTTAKRPQYYAAVTTGNIRVTRQVYGLGLLWSPAFGTALQSVSADPSSNVWIYGTRRSGTSATYETAHLPATITAGGNTITPSNGVATLPPGDLAITYQLAASGTTYGQKTITLGESRVDVSISHSGSFSELLPLAHATDATLDHSGNRLTFIRPNGSTFAIEVHSPGASIQTGTTGNLTAGMQRRAVTLSASGSLAYSLTLGDGNPSPPETVSPAFASTPPATPVDLDLRAFASDGQTPADRLSFALGQVQAGGAVLLDDRHTARFTPAADFNGTALLPFSVRDQGNDPRLLRHYRFEAPDLASDGLATDASAFGAAAELAISGGGTASYQIDRPPPFPSGEGSSLRLAQSGASGIARMRTTLAAATHDLSHRDWTASLWFKRAGGAKHDFLFYIGSGNGFSGDGDELEIFAPANANTVRMQYWDAANQRQAELTSPATAVPNQWHHLAAVWQAGGAGEGTLSLFLNGVSFGSATFTAAFKQSSPLVFGGVQSGAGDSRHLDGWLDDVALFSAALDGAEITSLASRPVANHAGLEANGSITITIDPLAADLGGHWPFDEHLLDISGGGREMVAFSTAALDTGTVKQGAASLQLPAVGDHVASIATVPLGDQFTLAAWIRLPSGQSSIRTIAANSTSGFNSNGFRFFVNRYNANNAELVLETGNGSQATLITSPAGTVALDRWQHVAARIDRASGTATLFLNASPVASGPVRTDFANHAPLALGSMIGGLHTLRGHLDDARLYQVLLDDAGITALFIAAGPGNSALWTATTTGLPLAWSDAGNWSANILPNPGLACDLDFLSGTVGSSGTIIANQDLALPFVARFLRLGGSGAATVRIEGSPLHLTANGPATPSVMLDSSGAMIYQVDTPVQLANPLFVSGNGDAAFEFRAAISGPGGIVKSGASRIHLSGSPKTFTGTAEVIGGTLAVETPLQSTITVSSGATLRGQGGSTSGVLELLPGAVVELLPGSWSQPPAAFTATQLMFTSAILRVDSTNLTGFTESGQVFPLLHSTTAIGQPDLSLLIIDAPGFPGAGRWSVEILAGSQTLALRYQADLYQAWIHSVDWQGRDSGAHADPDGDGVANFLEYALGGDPLAVDPGILPALLSQNGRLALGFERIGDPDLIYEVLASDDPTGFSWQSIWSSTGSASLPGLIIVDDSPPFPAPERRFLRLKVSRAALPVVP